MATEEQIRELAFSIWEQEGRPGGKEREHYFRAKQVLEAKEATRIMELSPKAPAIELAPQTPHIELASPPQRKNKKYTRRKKR